MWKKGKQYIFHIQGSNYFFQVICVLCHVSPAIVKNSLGGRDSCNFKRYSATSHWSPIMRSNGIEKIYKNRMKCYFSDEVLDFLGFQYGHLHSFFSSLADYNGGAKDIKLWNILSQ